MCAAIESLSTHFPYFTVICVPYFTDEIPYFADEIPYFADEIPYFTNDQYLLLIVWERKGTKNMVVKYGKCGREVRKMWSWSTEKLLLKYRNILVKYGKNCREVWNTLHGEVAEFISEKFLSAYKMHLASYWVVIDSPDTFIFHWTV